MTRTRGWPTKAMYILLAAALAIGLFLSMAPTHQVSASPDGVKAEWSQVDTPTMQGFVLAPGSTIWDFATASGGDVGYAVVSAYDETFNSSMYADRLLKSTDGAATWTDLTDTLNSTINDDGFGGIDSLLKVETDGTDPDFIAVALTVTNDTGPSPVHVYFSNDGGDTFFDGGAVVDGTTYFDGSSSNDWGVTDLAVSPEVSGKRDIAIGGGDVNNPAAGDGAGIFRATVSGETVSGWADGTGFTGFDDGVATESYYVTFMEFSPNYATDRTLLITTAAYGSSDSNNDAVYLQCGSWGTSNPGWNDHSTLGIDAVTIIDDVVLPTDLIGWDPRGLAGLTLPSDYNSKNTDTRVLWVWVNYFDYNWDTSTGTGDPQSVIMRVDNDAADAVGKQVKNGDLWLTNVSYYGTIAEGKAIAGILGTGGVSYEQGDYSLFDLMTDCEPVQVYRNTGINDMDICCTNWQKACKPPTGSIGMAVAYVSADKAYAVALDGLMNGDEGAWSVSFDDGNTWNQLSLIDTYISYFSDTAVSPDCNKMWVVSVNKVTISHCNADSVWLKATDLPEASEYSGYWLRVWNGNLEGQGFEASGPVGFIRLPADETAGDTVFLVDYGTSNVYMNDLEGLGCWTPIGSTTLDDIVDLTAPTADTLYALDYNGDVSMYDSEGWHDAVASKVDNGWSIAVHGDYVLVGSAWDGQVSYSDDAGGNFTLLDKTVPFESGADNGHTTVAFDTYFDTNSAIYAAEEEWGNGTYGGIFDWVLGTSTDWTDLGADHDLAYTGLILSYLGGNPFTSADTGGVLYASYKYENGSVEAGVARTLTPLAGAITCSECTAEWDYLTYGLPDKANFEAVPYALKVCGCLTADSNTKLFAIDVNRPYNMIDGTYTHDITYYAPYDGIYWVDDVGGGVWTFEDCYAKKAPVPTFPNGDVIGTSSCGCCNVPFTILWDQLCDSCYYDIQFSLDAGFTQPVELSPTDGSQLPDYVDGPYSSIEGTYYEVSPTNGASPSLFLSCFFQPETTYYWRIRAAGSGDQEIRSWWSDAQSFTVAPNAADAAINLVSPAPGALNQPIKNVGFSWTILATADSFDWVLSTNADLSSPLGSETGLASTATTYTGTLTHGMTYYWQVKAYNGGTLISTSAIGTFTTGALGAYCDPIDGMCFDTQADLQAHEASAHPAAATPAWVWVVIAIGAVLVIVVIVLIFRTRRV